MLINNEQAVLLIIDMQEHMMPAIHNSQQVTDEIKWLAQLASHLNLPIVITEHCADKIGHTVAPVLSASKNAQLIDKHHFSACANNVLNQSTAIQQAKQIIVCGVESHVCVLQTSLDLIKQDKQLFMVKEALSSRKPHDYDLACNRLQQAGATLVSREMVAFELLKTATHPEFSFILKNFIK